jgi:hypothetical protein
MELFSEIYSTYYHAVERLLREAYSKPLTSKDMQVILTDSAFSESAYQMLPKLQSGDWPVIKDRGNGFTSLLSLPLDLPLTRLQLCWLKSVLRDKRIRLFFDEDELIEIDNMFADIPVLFNQEDFFVFDLAKDGDPYMNDDYRRHFRIFLNAINKKAPIAAQYEGGKGRRLNSVFWPYKIEYSSKDDKFRALCYRHHGFRKVKCILNLGRVVSVHMAHVVDNIAADIQEHHPAERFGEVILEITKERNALERCMIQFAHYEKRTEYDESTNRYTCVIKYNIIDESELVIRVLSFGPTIKVLGPERFLQEIKQRVDRQTMLLIHHQNQISTTSVVK